MANFTPRSANLAALALVGALLTGCGNDVGSEAKASTTTEGAPPTSIQIVTSVVTVPDTPAPDTTATPPTEAPLGEPSGEASLDWDGTRYDFGRITGVSSNENEDLITFDRYQLYGDDGELQSAADFTEEPVVYGNGDVPWVNENPQERTYVLHPEAEVLSLVNPGNVGCIDMPVEEPEWQSNTVADLVAEGAPDSDQVSLMFNDDGLVTLVRISQGC
ncbi:MAG: hypothetical protein R2704_17680 [Microthrixaceae bacterium]